MKKILLSALAVFSIMACSNNSMYEDHILTGNYQGQWEIAPVDVKMIIQANDEKDGLILLLNLADSIDMMPISETTFDTERFERNGFSNQVYGELVGDTLYLENETYNIADKEGTLTIRKGTFGKQE